MTDINNLITLRPLEREDLRFVHTLDNNAVVMRYWFEEPFVSFDELVEIYQRHTHDQSERRFIVANAESIPVGLVELVEINLIHRHAEFQIIIAPGQQGRGYAKQATQMAIDYAFQVLNLHKLSLYVDKENTKAIHIYTQLGYAPEGTLREEFFVNGAYRDAIRMCILQRDYLAKRQQRK
jgi:diamine N-acetyltransferase